MFRSTRWLFVAALLPVAACSSGSSNAPVSAAPPASSLSAADQAFVSGVAGIDAGEIQSSQLAATKARSARVKSFAAKILADHQSVDQQLMTIAQSKGVTPDATPPQMMSDAMTKLNADTAATFDRDYLREQVGVAEAAIKALQDEIANGQDADLKQFASTVLPTVQQHLAMARRLGGGAAPATTTTRRRHS